MTSAARGQEVRRRLVRAAAELIAERGWGAVSTRLVAARAGVAPGLVHYHFASVQALLARAAVGVLRELVAGVPPLLERACTAEDAADLVLEALDRYTGRDPTSLLIAEAYLAATRDEALRREVAAVVENLRADLATWLRARDVAAPEQTAAVFAAAIDGVLLHRTLGPDLRGASVAPVLRRLLRPSAADREGGPE